MSLAVPMTLVTMSACSTASPVAVSRKAFCTITAAAVCARPRSVFAAVKTYKASDAAAAVGRMRSSRAELAGVNALLGSSNFDGALDAVESASSTLEKDCSVLVQSPVLSADDKVAIGTIRRYGIGADVLIMLGGVAEATREENKAKAQDLLKKGIAALDEVLAIAGTYDALQ